MYAITSNGSLVLDVKISGKAYSQARAAGTIMSISPANDMTV